MTRMTIGAQVNPCATSGRKLVVASLAHRRSAAFLFRLMTLVIEHAHFGTVGSLAFLPADFFNPLRLCAGGAAALSVDLVKQQPARQKAIERLRALLLAFNPDTCRPMMEHNTG